MKSRNIKKTLSTSMASLTVLSNLAGLNSAKVHATPVTPGPKTEIYSEKEIEFTLGDMVNLETYHNVHQNLEQLVDDVPNLFNLLKIERNLDEWQEAINIFFYTFATIVCGEQSCNLKFKDIEGLCSRYILIGNTINQIRNISKSKRPSKNNEYVIVVNKFLEDNLGIPKNCKWLPFKDLRKILRIRGILMPKVEKLKKTRTGVEIRNLKEAILESTDIRWGLQDPTIKEMVDVTLQALEATDNFQIAEFHQYEARKSCFRSCQLEDFEKGLDKLDAAEIKKQEAKEFLEQVMGRVEIIVNKRPGKILMEKLRQIDKRMLANKKEFQTTPRSFQQKINYFENFSKKPSDKIDKPAKSAKNTEKLKTSLIDLINGANEETFDKIEKDIEKKKFDTTDAESKKVIDTAIEAIKAKQILITAEIKTLMANDLKENALKNLQKLENSKNETEEFKKEYALAQENQKSAVESETAAKNDKQKAEKSFLAKMEKLGVSEAAQKPIAAKKEKQEINKATFTFRDLEKLMNDGSISQKEFEDKIVALYDFIDTDYNKQIWYGTLDEFEICCDKLIENSTDKEKIELYEKIGNLPAVDILNELKDMLMNRCSEKECLEVVSKFLGVKLKNAQQEEKTEEELNSQEDSATLSTQTQEETPITENLETPSKVQTEEPEEELKSSEDSATCSDQTKEETPITESLETPSKVQTEKPKEELKSSEDSATCSDQTKEETPITESLETPSKVQTEKPKEELKSSEDSATCSDQTKEETPITESLETPSKVQTEKPKEELKSSEDSATCSDQTKEETPITESLETPSKVQTEKPKEELKSSEDSATCSDQTKEETKETASTTNNLEKESKKKKKSFWLFILDLLKKIPLIGRFIRFLCE